MAWAKNGTPDTLASELDDMDITDLTAYKFNMFMIHKLATGNAKMELTLDNTTGNDYTYRESKDGATDTTGTSQANLLAIHAGKSNDDFTIIYGINIDSEEKLLYIHTVGAGTTGAASAPERREYVGKFDTSTVTAQYTRIDINNSDTGGYLTSSNISAIGTD